MLLETKGDIIALKSSVIFAAVFLLGHYRVSPVYHREHTHRGNNSEWKKERGGECEKEGG